MPSQIASNSASSRSFAARDVDSPALAPIAARSDSAAATAARPPRAARAGRSKCTPSTTASIEVTETAPSGLTTAASSPLGTTTLRPTSRSATRLWMRELSVRKGIAMTSVVRAIRGDLQTTAFAERRKRQQPKEIPRHEPTPRRAAPRRSPNLRLRSRCRLVAAPDQIDHDRREDQDEDQPHDVGRRSATDAEDSGVNGSVRQRPPTRAVLIEDSRLSPLSASPP